ncbi:MAG: class I SAM-dependent RNA methyltransferase [Spirochaetes bacterium]|nr:class I SAM-dependent RNA methyltransferase [Spirochaetota bacterium]
MFENLERHRITAVNRQEILTIEKWAQDGVAIAHDSNNKIIFVRYVIPGEKAKVKIYKEAKDYALGEPLEILESSPLRKTSECPYFGLCGGCDLQMISYEEQLKVKQELVKEAFYRIGKIEINEFHAIISSPQPFYYRNNAIFKVYAKKKKIGFFQKDTKNIVNLEQCMLASSEINQALAKIRNQSIFPPHNFKVRSTNTNGSVVHWVKCDDYQDRDIVETITAAGKTIKFKISKDSFFQVNNSVIPLWLEKIISYLDAESNERIFDLYCGIGLITFFVSYYAKETIGIEVSKLSIKDARKNMKSNQITSNVRFEAAAVEDRISDLGYADTIIVDPPRKGLDKHTIETLLDMQPKKIIYSSCKSTTMARDIAFLSSKYQIKDITLVDMFPQTYHVEVLTLLERKE